MRERLLVRLVLVVLLLSLMLPMSGLTLTPPSIEWSKRYGIEGEEWAWSVIQTSDGGYALVGWTRQLDDDDVLLVKTDAEGNMQWSRTYGGASIDQGRSVVQTVDGGYVLAAGSYEFGLWLIKTDAEGNIEWSKSYVDLGFAYAMVQTSDGGYALASVGFSLVKTDANGNLEWSQTYGGTNEEWATSVIQTSDGGYALAGQTYSFAGYADFWLVKTDSAGNMEWSQAYGGESNDYAWSVIQTSDGGYALGGSSDGGADFWLVKTDAEGNMEWDQKYRPEAGLGEAWSMTKTVDGGYALAGMAKYELTGDVDLWLVKTDAEGNMK